MSKRWRILMVHNAYQQRGGEDSVVAAEIDLLRRYGHAVELYTRSNDEVTQLSAGTLARQTLWSGRTVRELAALIQTFAPDVIHAHNTFPLVSPSLYWAAARARVPLVQTLHNFRLLCPNALFLRYGSVCEDCLGRLPWRGAIRACYRGSHAASSVLAAMLIAHRALGTYRHKVTRFVALNAFCKNKFVVGGLSPERIAIKPNFVDFPPMVPQAREGLLFVGRLSVEKGIGVLAEALQRLPGVCMRVAGSGPDAAVLDGLPGVIRLGSLSGEGVREEMGRSLALVVPSIWYENFPRTIVEAYAAGLPVIASRIGALAEIVRDGETGLLFEAGNPNDLAQKLAWALAHPDEMRRMGEAARAEYETRYTPEINYRQLLAIYDDAIEETSRHAAS